MSDMKFEGKTDLKKNTCFWFCIPVAAFLLVSAIVILTYGFSLNRYLLYILIVFDVFLVFALFRLLFQYYKLKKSLNHP
ncbi:MAG TPA: hypothetical protein VHR42_07330 [Clostridia bacterium]|nr:hypothetical protein [Clostridia bacterium]